MSTNLIDVHDNCLACPSKLDLANVLSFMLWPDNAFLRKRAFRALAIDAGRSLIPHMSRESLNEWAAIAADSSLIDDVDGVDGLAKRLNYGWVAGKILASVVAAESCRPKKEKISTFQNALAKDCGEFGITKDIIRNNIWTSPDKGGFRCVAHLWAANILLVQKFGERDLPCRRPRLGWLIAVAQQYLIKGESLRTHQSPTRSILPVGEAFRFSPSLKAVPKVELVFTPKAA